MSVVRYKPCSSCPFRSDKPGYLTPERAREIVASDNFSCHKTVDYDEEGEGRVTHKSLTCAGFAILCELTNHPSQMMRIAERLGLYDRRRLNMQAPVHRTVAAFINAQPKRR